MISWTRPRGIQIRTDRKQALEANAPDPVRGVEISMGGDELEAIACESRGLVDGSGCRFGVAQLHAVRHRDLVRERDESVQRRSALLLIQPGQGSKQQVLLIQ